MDQLDYFKDIRPYHDDEIRPVLDSLMANSEFLHSIASFYYPRLTRLFPAIMLRLASRRLKSQLKNVHDVASVQDLIAIYMDKMIEDTTTRLTHSGMENLQEGRGYLFISNHRDIAMDPAFVNYMLYHAGFQTLQIAIGDNLLKKPFVTDLMRLNKSFIVRRSLKGRELLKSLSLLSEYIHHCIDGAQNVWIAQREGRAKDGIDKTDPALLKMLSMGRRKLSFRESLSSLHIVPVAISYEYDACDVLKAKELTEIELKGNFTKTEGSDIHSIVTGMIGFKGDVHVAFGRELDLTSEDPEVAASIIDRQILQNYQLRDSNFLALEKLEEAGLIDVSALKPEFSERIISDSSRAEFTARLSKVDSKLHKHYLNLYANPVINRFRREG